MRAISENDICENCKFFSELEHNFEVEEGFDHSYCCTLFANENYVIEVAPNDRCEEFTAREDSVK